MGGISTRLGWAIRYSLGWGSGVRGTGQAPHCPYRHGTARGAAATSVDADRCPHAVVTNGTVDYSWDHVSSTIWFATETGSAVTTLGTQCCQRGCQLGNG